MDVEVNIAIDSRRDGVDNKEMVEVENESEDEFDDGSEMEPEEVIVIVIMDRCHMLLY